MPVFPAPREVAVTSAPAPAPHPQTLALGWRGGFWATLTILVSAFLSQGLSFSDLAFSLFWPPAGIAFALCWRYGASALPAIALGIAVPTFAIYPGWGSIIVVLGESLGPWAGVLLLRRLSPPPTGQVRLRWQIAFYVCGMTVACPIAALFGSVGSVAGHRFTWTALPGVFLAYTMVEAIGLVLFAPPVIEWLSTRDGPGATADPRRSRRIPWVFLVPLGIESARWLLHAAAGGQYADILIYGYFPLIAWCALTESSQRTHGLLLWIAVATLSSEALRLHGNGAPIASFDLFRIALVTLILCTMGQVLAALAIERAAAFADVARQRDLDPLTGLLNETSFARALEVVPGPYRLALLAFENWPEFEILAGIGAGYDLQREVATLLREVPDVCGLARLQPGTFAIGLRSALPWPAPLGPLLERRWSRSQVDMRLVAVALDVPEGAVSPANELLLGVRTALNDTLFSGDDRPVLRAWSPDLVAGRRSHERLVEIIRHQVRAGEVRLFAQPIVQIGSARRPSLEILVRIPDDRGEPLPSEDVARVLAHNLISTELDRVVIRSTFDWFAARPGELAAVERVAINLTGASLSTPSLFEWIERCRSNANLAARHFSFELTESQAILNMESARMLVGRLRDAGYGVALDDFGTGLATFDYLKRFTVDYLKIDGSFIRNLAANPVDREIVNGIVRLARVMGIGTVAEYVADEAIASAAVNAGVDALQGYAIQAPVPLADALHWCRSADPARWREWTDPLVRQIVS